MQHITVLLRNLPGEFSAIADMLERDGVRILAFHVANTGPRSGYVQLLCDDHLRAFATLSGSFHNYVHRSEVLVVRIGGGAGMLARLLERLCRAQVNIENAYQTLDSKGQPLVVMEIPTEHMSKAVLALQGVTECCVIGEAASIT